MGSLEEAILGMFILGTSMPPRGGPIIGGRMGGGGNPADGPYPGPTGDGTPTG